MVDPIPIYSMQLLEGFSTNPYSMIKAILECCHSRGLRALVSWSCESSTDICPRSLAQLFALHLQTLIVVLGEQSVARLALVPLAPTTFLTKVRVLVDLL